MRQYSYHATDDTIEALRLLRQPWRGFIVTEWALTVQLTEAGAVRIEVERGELEPNFEAFRLVARRVEEMPALFTELGEHAPDFAAGKNDVVVFRGETWLEPSSGALGAAMRPGTTLQLTGRAGQRSTSAEAVATTTDAIVVATPRGTGLLARIGLRPLTLDVTDDRDAIARFLRERQYSE